jgi:chromosomal replication initiation ATPase DnaA
MKTEAEKLSEVLMRVPEAALVAELRRRRDACSGHRMVAAVADAWRVGAEEVLRLRTRQREVTDARQAAMVLLREVECWSYPRIGTHFGMDHSTALHAVRSHARRMRDAEFSRRYEAARAAATGRGLNPQLAAGLAAPQEISGAIAPNAATPG